MPGRIRAEDITSVKERSSIEDVVRDHVTLRPAGVGSLKGLCPFHDEKTPRFTVRPAVGSYHCFGCGEGGDVISFVQKVEHLTFAEAVERLAAKAGMELRYEEGGGPREGGDSLGQAHPAASRRTGWRRSTTASVLLDLPAPRPGPAATSCASGASTRPRRSASASASRPRDGEELTRHLLRRGFTDEELTDRRPRPGGAAAASTTASAAGWSGRSATSPATPSASGRAASSTRTASRPKYLNTPETPIYKKSQRPLRPRPREEGDRQATGGPSSSRATPTSWLPPVRGRDRRRHLRHRLRRRPHQDPASDHARRGRRSRPPGSSSPSTATPPGRRPR